jgi:hypothetical protein
LFGKANRRGSYAVSQVTLKSAGSFGLLRLSKLMLRTIIALRRGVLPGFWRLRSHPSNLNLDNASAGTGSTIKGDVPA